MAFVVSRRAPLRLPADAYADLFNPFSITIGVNHRVRVFANLQLARASVEVLREHLATTAVSLHAYCFMPDHVHVLVTASPRCDVVKFVGGFKSLVARASWPLGYTRSFWQPRFWDESVPREQTQHCVDYILENPVRAGLVKRVEDYEFSGTHLPPRHA